MKDITKILPNKITVSSPTPPTISANVYTTNIIPAWDKTNPPTLKNDIVLVIKDKTTSNNSKNPSTKNAPKPFGNISSCSTNFLINGSFRKINNNGMAINTITYIALTNPKPKNIFITKPKIEI